MLKTLRELWTDANGPMDYIIALWIYGLAGLFAISWTALVIELIMNPSRFSNATFGIFDTLG